ncbi:MAG: putative sporulation protein YtxC [Desulfitobacterium hafniense]|nr:putative sporulation protein YtxC [Desulfitobacterium hafniense]
MEQHSVQLGTVRYKDYISNQLLQLRDREALPISLEEYKQGKRWLINCCFEIPSDTPVGEHKTVERIHSYYLANALADIILRHWEKDYLKRTLQKKHRLKKDECASILNKAVLYLNNGVGQSAYYKINRKTGLVNQILTCFEDGILFDVEGFLRFRANEYKNDLEKAVSYAVDEYVLEKEYFEFINLLKHFVDSQTPKLDTLHVGINSLGKFNLFNDLGKRITSQYLDDYSLGDTSGEFSYEDLLVSALIAVAPRQIVLHIRYEGYQDTLHTIRQIFEGRVSYCTGSCNICKNV